MTPQLNPFEQSQQALNFGSDIWASLGADGALSNVNDYINPYYEQVLDAALGRMDRQYQTMNNQIGDQAAMAGAFGGSRHGVMEGVLAGEHLRNVGELTANTQAQGFNQGVANAFQDAQVRGMAGDRATQLGGMYFDIGNNIMGTQAQQGQQVQDLFQAILNGGAGQFDQYMQTPYQTIDILNALLSSDPRRGAGQTTAQSTPGLFDYLSLGAQAVSGTSLW